ncbi:hypothetical protein BDY21DRAFT_382259 [Lineolata rhizophorae]|uniref:Nuclear transport factor 2 n=1 Tax=Lineolata rhizophorae TaxID=578093 RepID=A0A6A6NNU6_9PEZI|nr:hypothetical protein BDY21DRAFT_382259 [Lineolata rhizophorae]
MTRVLLTGGSGFIAAWVLDLLLQQGHSVVTTVRSRAKADAIKAKHPEYGSDKLSFAIVPDIAVEGAFDDAVKSDPPFEAVLHTASPFHYNVTDIQKDLLDPALIGTTSILKAIKKSAPSVKRVVVTSSFAAVFDPAKGDNPGYPYSEADWSPLTHEQALENMVAGYRYSKTSAERAAWDFVEKEKPNFTLSTICPPLVLGPTAPWLASLDNINTSNARVRDAILGKFKENGEIPPSGVYLWIDVRDLAIAHVKAMDVPDAAGKRFFTTAGYFSNKEIVELIRKNFPEYADKLPPPDVKGGDYPPGGVYKYDNSRSKEVLGLEFMSLEKSVVDLVNSLKAVGEQFVEFYYKTFDENRAGLAGLYRDTSMLTFESSEVQGTASIVEKLTNLPFQKVVHQVATLDAQPTQNGIVVLVTGALLVDEEQKPMSYTQLFNIIAESPGSYYVFNDMFRLVYSAS